MLRAQVLRPSPPGHGQAATGVRTVGAAAAPTRAGIRERGWDGDGARGAGMGPLSGSQPRQRPYRLGRDGRGGLTARLPLGSSLRLRTSLAPGTLSFLRRPRRLLRSKHPPKGSPVSDPPGQILAGEHREQPEGAAQLPHAPSEGRRSRFHAEAPFTAAAHPSPLGSAFLQGSRCAALPRRRAPALRYPPSPPVSKKGPQPRLVPFGELPPRR